MALVDDDVLDPSGLRGGVDAGPVPDEYEVVRVWRLISLWNEVRSGHRPFAQVGRGERSPAERREHDLSHHAQRPSRPLWRAEGDPISEVHAQQAQRFRAQRDLAGTLWPMPAHDGGGDVSSHERVDADRGDDLTVDRHVVAIVAAGDACQVPVRTQGLHDGGARKGGELAVDLPGS